ncbi:hypothetical protein AGMMS49959_00910 [Planctomycetales bacterium]|nr:hypothetical protein AGMMS49959_00910 [Planctomycetales bacterium]
MPTLDDLRPLTADLPPLVLLSSADNGGAGIVARRLLEGLIAAGADAKMITLVKASNLPQIGELRDEDGKRLWSYLREEQESLRQIYPSVSAGWFSTGRAWVNLADYDLVKNASLIHLHWISGLVGFPQAREFLADKPVVWTMHDMNPFTGGCHYAGACGKYRDGGCADCPQLRPPSRTAPPPPGDDLAAGGFQNKRLGYENLHLHLVSICGQMGELAAASLLLRSFPQTVIPNMVDTAAFAPSARADARRKFNLPPDRQIILFGATTIYDPRKGLKLFIEAINLLAGIEVINLLAEPAEPAVVFFGDCGGEANRPGLYFLGRIDDPQALAELYAAADVFVTPAIEEAFGNTTAEALACGTPVIAFPVGAARDFIKNGENGYLANLADPVDLAVKIKIALALPKDRYEKMRENARATAVENLSLPLVVERYLRLYRRMLNLPER